MSKKKPNQFDVICESKEQVSPPLKRKWTQPDKGKINYNDVISWIKTKLNNDEKDSSLYHLIVGTDSQKRSNKVRFVTIIALYKEGKGGMYFYTSHLLPKELFGKTKHDKSRIYQEVEYSIETANQLMTDIGDQIIPSIHIDASPKHKKEYTSDISDNLMSLICSYGFEPCIKPFSFAASSIANKHSKG